MPWDVLSDEQRELRDLVRQLARERIAPRAAEIDESHEFPWDVVELFRDHELFGLFFAVNFIGDNVVKPKLMGTGLGLSPLLIVVSLLVWGVVLGPMGALLAIPLTLTVKEVLPVLMGDPPPSLPGL